jgi:hypothetical protein
LSSDVTTAIDTSLGGIALGQWTLSDGSGVAAAQCPSGTIVGSANCDCEGDGQTRNFGVMFGCNVAGNGGVAGCFPEGATYNPTLPVPVATITLVCASAIQNDGTPIQPIFSKAGLAETSKIATDNVEFDSAVNDARSKVAIYNSILQNR